jgi:hypothetical protein
MVDRMGCEPEGTISVLYAKAESVRTNSKSRRDRHTLNQKAYSAASPTIIFKGPRYLKYFLDHFSAYMHDYLPPIVVGYSGDPLPQGPTSPSYRGTPSHMKDFLKDQSFRRYLSNLPDGKHLSLEEVATPSTAIPDYFATVESVLTTAQAHLAPDQFALGIDKLFSRFKPSKEVEVSTTMKSLSLAATSRDSSPSKRQRETMVTPRITYQRKVEPLAKEQEEAQSNLEYSYSMDLESDDSS